MFDNFKKLIDNILNENVDDNLIKQAISGHNEIMINYSGDDNTHTGKRLIQVYAYGLTKAGFPCIRAYEPYGDTKSRIPHWKLFRLDRILKWTPTDRKFVEPPKEQGWNAEEFNQNGDGSMSVVYTVAQFEKTSDLERLRNKTSNLKQGNPLSIGMFKNNKGQFTKDYNKFRTNINKSIKNNNSEKLGDEYWNNYESPSNGMEIKDKNSNGVDDGSEEDDDIEDYLNTPHNNMENKWKGQNILSELLIKLEKEFF